METRMRPVYTRAPLVDPNIPPDKRKVLGILHDVWQDVFMYEGPGTSGISQINNIIVAWKENHIEADEAIGEAFKILAAIRSCHGL